MFASGRKLDISVEEPTKATRNANEVLDDLDVRATTSCDMRPQPPLYVVLFSSCRPTGGMAGTRQTVGTPHCSYGSPWLRARAGWHHKTVGRIPPKTSCTPAAHLERDNGNR